jgi:predicted HTH domain antitoxin
MSSVTVEIPENLAALMKGLPIEQMTYEAIVLDLYRRATISSGKAAELLGLGHIEFIKSAGKLGIPYIQMSPEELASEIAAAKTL